MVDIELKRDRLTIRFKTQKWEWMIEPRYWRNSILWVALLLVFPAVSYFVSPGLINTMISANLLAAIAIPMSLMTLGTGRVNFGPNFYVGVGGYAAALLSIAYGWGPVATLPFAILTTLFAALLQTLLLCRGLYCSALVAFTLCFFEVKFLHRYFWEIMPFGINRSRSMPKLIFLFYYLSILL